MTIAAGFCTSEGIVPSADMEYSGIGVKTFEPKIFEIPRTQYLTGLMAFSGTAELALPTVQRCIHELSVSDQSVHIAERTVADGGIEFQLALPVVCGHEH